MHVAHDRLAPTAASVLSGAVTAEAAGASPVVPAIHSTRVKDSTMQRRSVMSEVAVQASTPEKVVSAVIMQLTEGRVQDGGYVRDTCLCRIGHKHAYAARHIMTIRATMIAKKSIYSNGLCHIQRGIYAA